MESDLPIIDSCGDCGACCMEQQSPPGYAMLLSSPELMDDAEMFADDVARLRNLPAEAMKELRDYLKDLLGGRGRPDDFCIWLDRSTKQCRFHEHRPMICRDMEVGGENCRGWRRSYQVDS